MKMIKVNTLIDQLYWVIVIFLLVIPSSCSCNDETELVFKDPIIDPFSEYIILIGDVQEYTVDKVSILPLQRSINWIQNQSNAFGNISCVLQNGDVTWGNKPDQWKLFQETILKLNNQGIPVYTCTGNHDYTWINNKINDRGSSLINEYLNSSILLKSVKAQFEEDKIDNLIVHLPLKTADIDLIILEFAPRTEAVQWAKEWVSNHPKQNYILMTHEFLRGNGSVQWTDTYAELHFDGTNSTKSTPKDLINNLILPNPNIKAVICGHNGFARVNTTESPCPVLLFNLQYQQNGGDSMLLLMKVDSLDKKIHCVVYHTDKQIPISSDLTDFSFSYAND